MFVDPGNHDQSGHLTTNIRPIPVLCKAKQILGGHAMRNGTGLVSDRRWSTIKHFIETCHAPTGNHFATEHPMNNQMNTHTVYMSSSS